MTIGVPPAHPRIFCTRFSQEEEIGIQGEIVRPDNKADTQPSPIRRGGKAQGKERNIGDSLRAVYREAVEETVPDELLDLLKKLS